MCYRLSSFFVFSTSGHMSKERISPLWSVFFSCLVGHHSCHVSLRFSIHWTEQRLYLLGRHASLQWNHLYVHFVLSRELHDLSQLLSRTRSHRHRLQCKLRVNLYLSLCRVSFRIEWSNSNSIHLEQHCVETCFHGDLWFRLLSINFSLWIRILLFSSHSRCFALLSRGWRRRRGSSPSSNSSKGHNISNVNQRSTIFGWFRVWVRIRVLSEDEAPREEHV